GICVAKMLDKTSSIICAFGLASAAPRSPYRHLELCGIASGSLAQKPETEYNVSVLLCYSEGKARTIKRRI
ncbi:MAG: hypothetical protein WAX82_08180, partial [Gemmiger qucibialis]